MNRYLWFSLVQQNFKSTLWSVQHSFTKTIVYHAKIYDKKKHKKKSFSHGKQKHITKYFAAK